VGPRSVAAAGSIIMSGGGREGHNDLFGPGIIDTEINHASVPMSYDEKRISS